MTEVELKEYVDVRLKMLEEKIFVKIEALDKSVIIAKKENDRRLEGMNEFRADLDRKDKTLVTRESFEVVIQSLRETIEKMAERLRYVEQARSNLDGRIVTAGFIIVILIQFVLAYYKQ